MSTLRNMLPRAWMPGFARTWAGLFATIVGACGGRTTLPIGGAGASAIQIGTDAGIMDGPSDVTVLPDSSEPPYDAPHVDCQVGPYHPIWTIPVAAGTDSILFDVYAVSAAQDGSVFAAGCGILQADRCPNSIKGSGPCFLVKLDPNGKVLFEDRFTDGINDPLAVALSTDTQGGVVVGLEDDEGTDLGGQGGQGSVVGRFDAVGQTRFFRNSPMDTTSFFAFAADTKARSVIAGLSPTEPTVMRFDETGAQTAKLTLSTIAPARINTVAMQADGTILVGGYGAGPVDFGTGPKDLGGGSLFLATFDSSLNFLNLLVAGAGGGAQTLQAAPSADGTAFIIGGSFNFDGFDLGGGPLFYTGNNPRGGPNADIFLAELSTRLEHRWSYRYGDATSQQSLSLCVDPMDGTIGWIGLTGAVTDFGNGQISSGVSDTPQDGFLVHMSADGSTALGLDTTESTVHSLACSPNSYILAGNVPDSPVDLGAGTVPVGGFILKRARP